MTERRRLQRPRRRWSVCRPMAVSVLVIVALNLGSVLWAQGADPSGAGTAASTTAPAPAVQPDTTQGTTARVAAARPTDVQLEDRVFEIGRKLRCPVCVSESVADSNAQIAQEMRQLIQTNLENGMSDKQILAYFQARYGDWILLDPPKRGLHLVVWILPIVAALGGIVFLGFKIRSWRAAADAPITVEPGELELVREAMKGDTP